MPRGYRLIILALIGLASLGASPQKPDHEQPRDNSAQDIANSLQRIAATLKDAQKPSQHDEPCTQGSDDRASDLCAQWKAADAAKSSAKATWVFGAIGSAIGLLTLAAAGAAAWYARQAAIHTETGADEARRAANAAEDGLADARIASSLQLRPYVNLTNSSRATPTPFSNGDAVPFAVRNFGQIPARNVQLAFGWEIVARPIGERQIEIEMEPETYASIAPGQRIEDTITMDFDPAELARIISGEVLLMRMKLSYQWEGGGADFLDLTQIMYSEGTNPWQFLLLSKEQRQRP